MFQRVLVAILFVVVGSISFGQEGYSSSINKDDSINEIEFPKILNHASLNSAKLPNFKGKIVILYYWSIWCKACLETFPKLEKLQQQFSEDLVIFPVSFLHNEQTIVKFLDARKGTDVEITLPLVVFENTENDLFTKYPTRGYPHVVWFDKDGNFLNTTSSTQITHSNLQKIIEGTSIELTTRSFQMDFDVSKPFLVNGNGGEDTAYQYRSILTDFKAGISYLVHHLEENTDKKRFLVQNSPIVDLFKYSLNNGFHFDPYNKQVIWEGLDRKRFIYNGTNEERESWIANNTYCYELTLPATYSKEELFEFMNQDLTRYFKIKSSIQNRKLECYALKTIKGVIPQPSRGNNEYLVDTDKNYHSITLGNKSLAFVAGVINRPEYPIIVDDTGISSMIDISLTLGNEFDLKSLNNQLAAHGFRLKKVKKRFKVLVLKKGD